MDNFQPLHLVKNKDDFSAWDMKTAAFAEPEKKVTANGEQDDEFSQIHQQAKQEGYAAGFKEAAAEIDKKRAELNDWLAIIQEPVRLLDKTLSDEVLQTIFWICEACIGIEVSMHPEKLLALIEQIKKELPAVQGNKSLLMHPDDIEWLKNNLDSQKYANLTAMLLPENSLQRGEFYLKSEHSDLDGRFKSRLQKLFGTYFNSDETLAESDSFGGSSL